MPRAPKLSPLPGKFVPAKGAHLSADEAEIYGPIIERIADDAGGTASPEAILRHAESNLRSPLRNYFEWNDAKAARGYRLEQASYLLRSICFEVVVNGEKQPPVRAFYSVTPHDEATIESLEPGRSRGYVPLKRVMSDEDLNEQIIAAAMASAFAWERRYGQYAAFKDIVTAIRVTAQRLGR